MQDWNLICVCKGMVPMDKERMRKGEYAVKNTWKEKPKLKNQPEIKKTRCLSKTKRYLSTNHKDFILIL